MIVEMLKFMLMMSIPVVGGALLYIELRYGKMMHKSVKYGCIYALLICCFMTVDNSCRIVGGAVDKLMFNECKTMKYIVRHDRSQTTLDFDIMRLKTSGANIVNAYSEQRICSRYSWNVLHYIPGKKMK